MTTGMQPDLAMPAERSAVRRAWSALSARRRTIAVDAAILTVLFTLSRFFALGLIYTDSVHASLALVFKTSVPPAPGGLVWYDYAGSPIRDFYPDGWWNDLQRWLGHTPDRSGPKPDATMIKYLLGVEGDRVERRGDHLVLHTRRGSFDVGRCKTLSRSGVPLQPLPDQVIPAGFVYVWAPHPDALDSRYAASGLVPVSAIRGRGVLLW